MRENTNYSSDRMRLGDRILLAWRTKTPSLKKRWTTSISVALTIILNLGLFALGAWGMFRWGKANRRGCCLVVLIECCCPSC